MTKTKSVEINTSRTVTPNGALRAMEFLVKAGRPAFIHGQPGIGKSDVVRKLAKKLHAKLYDLRLSQIDQVDLRGMPFFNHTSGMMEWAHPVDLPTHEEAAKHKFVILFLDEMNSAPPSVQAVAYQLILDRRVGTYTLPDNCIVIAAGNREGDRGVTYRMPKPLSNRFIHLEMRVDFSEWNEWAIENNIHPDVVGFLNFSESSLNDFRADSPELAFATPRTWEFASDVICTDIDETTAMDIISGTIGEGLALKFMAHRKLAGSLPNPRDIISGKVKSCKIDDISAQYSLAIAMLYALQDMSKDQEISSDDWHNMVDTFLGFIMDNMQQEIVVMSMRTALAVMRLPIDRKKLAKNYSRFSEGPGKLVLKSLNI